MASCVGKVAHFPQSGNVQSELHGEPLWFFSRSKNPELSRSSNTIFVRQMQKPNCSDISGFPSSPHSWAFHGHLCCHFLLYVASLHHDLPQSPFSSSPPVPSYLRHYWDIFVLRSTARKLPWPLTDCLFVLFQMWMSVRHLAFVGLAHVTILLGTTPASALLITCKSMEETTAWVRAEASLKLYLGALGQGDHLP